LARAFSAKRFAICAETLFNKISMDILSLGLHAGRYSASLACSILIGDFAAAPLAITTGLAIPFKFDCLVSLNLASVLYNRMQNLINSITCSFLSIVVFFLEKNLGFFIVRLKVQYIVDLAGK
jgi:hypothetical protein